MILNYNCLFLPIDLQDMDLTFNKLDNERLTLGFFEASGRLKQVAVWIPRKFILFKIEVFASASIKRKFCVTSFTAFYLRVV